MTSLSEVFSSDVVERLERIARREALSVEEFVQHSVEEKLSRLKVKRKVTSASAGDEKTKFWGEGNGRAVFQTLVEQAQAGVFLLQEGRLQYVNARLAEIAGYSQAELVGEGPFLWVHPDERPTLKQKITRCLKGGEASGLNKALYRVLTQENKQRYVELAGSRITYRGSAAVVGTVIDITAWKCYEQVLLDEQKKVKHRSRRQSLWINRMSHEVRAALVSMLGVVKLMDAKETKEKPLRQKHLGTIRRRGQQLLQTANAVADLACLENGSLSFNPKMFDLAKQLQETVSGFQKRVQQQGLRLTVLTHPEEILVKMDQQVTIRIIALLIEQAIEQTVAGGVTARLAANKETVWLQVEDTGMGIDPARTTPVFKVFEQQNVSSTHKGERLELAAVDKLVEAVGGAVEREYKKQDGTVVTVELPRRVEKKRLPEYEFSELTPAQKVLVVERDSFTHKLISAMLPDTYAVHLAMDVSSAIQKVQSVDYNMVFIDVNISPEESAKGVALLHYMRSLKRYQNTLFVALTAYAFSGDGEQMCEVGFDGCVSKPFTRKAFYERLRQLQ